MTEQLLTIFGGLLAAFVTAYSGFMANRVYHLEKRVDELETELNEEWRYQRELIDEIYRIGGKPPRKGNNAKQ